MVRLVGVVGEEEAGPGPGCAARRQVPLALEPGLTMVRPGEQTQTDGQTDFLTLSLD